MYLWQYKIVLLCFLVKSFASCRHFDRRSHTNNWRQKEVEPKFKPLYERSLNQLPESTSSRSMTKSNQSAKRLLLIKPTTGEPRDSARLFPDLLLLNGLSGNSGLSSGIGFGNGIGFVGGTGLGSGNGLTNGIQFGGGGAFAFGGLRGGAGSFLQPYVIVNTPTNVSNVNNNRLINVPRTTAAPTTTTTTGTRLFSYPPQQAPPTQFPMQVYQQRRGSKTQVPALILNLNNELLPSQLQSMANINQRRRIVHTNNNSADFHNPLVMLQNTLKRIPYF